MVDSEIQRGIDQTIPRSQRDKSPHIIQQRPVGSLHMTRIGYGYQGNIRLTFSQPQWSDAVAGIDTSTGDSIFESARRAERKTRGGIHAPDFPARPKALTVKETDMTKVTGIPLGHLRNTQRAHWPQVESRAKPIRPVRKKLNEHDVPWSTPEDSHRSGRFVVK